VEKEQKIDTSLDDWDPNATNKEVE